METLYSFKNSGEFNETIQVLSFTPVGKFTLYVNGDKSTKFIEGVRSIDIKSGDHVEISVDTENAYVDFSNSTSLDSILGPIERRESLDDVFNGCTGLVRVSDDVFSKNLHTETLSRTFKDCVMFCPDNNLNFLKGMENLKSLVETFKNTDIHFINNKMLSVLNIGSPKKFIRTFANCVELSNIGVNTFRGENLVLELNETFVNCPYLKSIHSEFFVNLPKGIVLNRTFSNTGITSINPNINTFIPEYATVKELFGELDLNGLNNFE